MNKRALILFSLIGILIVSAAGYLGFSTSKTPEPTPAPQTVSVARCDVEQTVTAPGNLVNVNQAEVKMPTEGRLSEVNVRLGDSVKAGEILAELGPVATTQAQLALIEAQEALEEIQASARALRPRRQQREPRTCLSHGYAED